MARPKKGDLSHRPVERECAFCGERVMKKRASNYEKAYCSKEHMISDLKSKSFFFECIVCDKKVYTQPAQIKYRNRRHCSRDCYFVTKKKETLERRKTYTKHQLDRLARYSKEAKEWREAVFKRDDYTCQMCSVRGTYLEADHIKPFAYFTDLRYELSNGRTLCKACHGKTKISAKRMKEIYGTVDNPLQGEETTLHLTP